MTDFEKIDNVGNLDNAVEKLLKIDAGQIKTPTKKVKMNLGKLGGETFVFDLTAVDPEVMSELQENMIKMNAKSSELSMNGAYHRNAMTIVEGCPSVFRNREIQKKLGAATPKELVKKLLLPGEIEDLRNEIEALSGYETDESKEEDVKN